MMVPHSFFPSANLPFCVAEAFLSTTCTWHTSRWYIWLKSYILSSKNLRTLFDLLPWFDQHELLVMTPAYYQLSNSAGFLQQHWLLIFICHCWPFNPPPTLKFSSSSMNGSNFIMLLHDFKHFPFPKEIKSCPKCLLWTDLIISISTIFIPPKSNGTLYCFVWSKSLADFFPLMQSSSFFIKHHTRRSALYVLYRFTLMSSKYISNETWPVDLDL